MKNVHIWQILLQLSYGDTCQLGMHYDMCKKEYRKNHKIEENV